MAVSSGYFIVLTATCVYDFRAIFSCTSLLADTLENLAQRRIKNRQERRGGRSEWLPELDVEKRLNGDIVWLKLAVLF